MNNASEQKLKIKRLIVDELMLKITPEEIGNDQPLFGPNSLGLDSVNALQLVVALEGAYGLKISDQAKAKAILANVDAIAAAVEANEQRA